MALDVGNKIPISSAFLCNMSLRFFIVLFLKSMLQCQIGLLLGRVWISKGKEQLYGKHFVSGDSLL